MFRHSIENFKAFKNKNSIELKPITLVFGANNAGKSSLLNSLIYAASSYENSDLDVNEVQIGEEHIQFGGIGNIVNTNGDGRLRIYQEYDIDTEDINGDERFWNSVTDKEVNKISGRFSYSIEVDVKNFNEPFVTSVELMLKNITVTHGNFFSNQAIPIERPAHLKISTISKDAPYLQLEIIEEYSCTVFAALANWDVISMGSTEIETTEKEYFEELNNFIVESKVVLDTSFCFKIDQKIEDYRPDFLFFGEYNSQEDIFEALAYNFFEHLVNTRPPSFNYIGPLRKAPSKFLSKNYGREGWFDRFYKQSRKRIKNDESINKQIDRFNTLLTDERYLGLDYKMVIEQYRSEMNTSRLLETLSFQNIRTGEIVSLQDLGMGFSQFLPILAELEFGNDSVIIEQPELHLHPGFQSRIGPVLSKMPKKIPFISTLEGRLHKNRYIVIETHSEHIIKSIQLEVAKFHQSGGEEGISHDDISILYISKDEEGSQIRELGLDEVGTFTEPWPDDFFERSADLTYERLKMVSKN